MKHIFLQFEMHSLARQNGWAFIFFFQKTISNLNSMVRYWHRGSKAQIPAITPGRHFDGASCPKPDWVCALVDTFSLLRIIGCGLKRNYALVQHRGLSLTK